MEDKLKFDISSHKMEELKKVELYLLRVFIETCNKLNLTYYVIGGTLLGTVRHKGFIPWDDDIDVAMPRKDYDIWIREAQKLIQDSTVFVQSLLTEEEYFANFAKLRKSDTTFIETSCHNLKINHGVYIDVFPLDYYPDNMFLRLVFDFKKRILTSKINQLFDFKDINYTLTYKIKRIFINFILKTPHIALLKRECLYSSQKSSSLWANFGGAWGKKEIAPIEWFGKGKKMLFEDIEVNVPVKYDKWLNQVYGDYMQLPPVEKRIAHHFTDVIDLRNSYRKYVRSNK